jgi:hypothetical protein
LIYDGKISLGNSFSIEDCESVEFTNNNDFCEWLFEQDEQIVGLCHNFKGNDSSFVMEWILGNMTAQDKTPNVLMNGSKILCLKFRKIKIIDSLSFIPKPLEKFSKTFDIKELKKDFSPIISIGRKINHIMANGLVKMILELSS